ncbi:MAG: hypothetical protein ABII18_13940 [bacterium]|nr:hypothetical protein [bacterium]MBU1917492.1 hypothetical protein [bacterium]
MKNNIVTIAIFIFVLTTIVACGTSGVTVIGNPGAQLDIILTNDIDEASSSLNSYVTINSSSSCGNGNNACYTPDTYILGLRNLGLIQCQSAIGPDIACPGLIGEEVDDNLASGESFSVFSLNTTITDAIIYQSTNATASSLVGDDTAIATEAITTAALYSGVQFGLDFIVTQYPTDNASTAPGNTGNGNDFVLYCLNQDGCSDLTGYSSVYDGLADGDVEEGDIVFLDAANEEWYYFDTDNEVFSLITSKPTNLLTQDSTANHPTGSENQVQYNASFGSALSPLNITQALINAGATDELTAIYTVEDTMSFTDKNGNDILDATEIETLTFGKFSITEFELSLDVFISTL